jgi:uncharacterized protein (TIGR03118 family)
MLTQRTLRFGIRVSGILTLSLSPAFLFASSYIQTNLVSNVPGLATVTNANLVDPWGVSFTATSPFWISDNVTNMATVTTGVPVVSATTAPMVPGGPTGQVANGTAGAFVVSATNTTAASFIFDTQAGTILAWNGGVGGTGTAVQEYSNPSASYTGLALATSGTNTYLYAANGNGSGSIDVFNSSWAPTTLTGNFKDPNLPAGYVPYNIQLIGGQLYVTYVEYNSSGDEIPSGVVDIYNTDGTFVSRFSTSPVLDAPWGITEAPSTFGSFGGDILIGNFLNGEINAFDPVSGAFLGALDSNGVPIADPGLWALEFRTGGTGNSTNALYFTAGIDDETNGLFGEITLTPEPAPFLLTGMGVLALALGRLRRLSSHQLT